MVGQSIEIICESDLLVHVAGIPVVMGEGIAFDDPNIFSGGVQRQFLFKSYPRVLLAQGGDFDVWRSAGFSFYPRVFFVLGLDGVVDLLLGDEVQRPDLLFGLQVVTGECSAVEKDQLIPVDNP